MTYIAEKQFDVDNEVTLKGTPLHTGATKEYTPHFLDMRVKISDSGNVRFEYVSDNIYKSFTFSSKPTIIGAYEIDQWIDEVYNKHNLD